MNKEIELGHGHKMRYIGWRPDDLPGNRENLGLSPTDLMPSIEKVGIIIDHPNPKGGVCSSFLQFDTPEVRRWLKPRQSWKVESWEPLTLSPSILCTACGDHGFIRSGKGVPA